MRTVFLTCGLFFLIATMSMALSSQAPYTVSVDVPYVSVDVAVVDSAGQPMPVLSQEDFSVFEDGVPQSIVSFSPVTAPYSILLLFDRSASTKGERDFMQRAIGSFLAGFRPQDRVAVAGFDESVEVLAGWNDNRVKVSPALAALSRAEPAVETRLYSSLVRAVEREFRGVSGRRAVIVFTDGRDSAHYKQTVKDERVPQADTDRDFLRSLKELREARIPLYFVAVNTDRNLGQSPGGDYLNLQRVFPAKGLATGFLKETRERLERIADATGGRVAFPESMGNVEAAYANMRSDLITSYTLGYISSNAAGRGGVRTIRVRVGRPDAVVRQSRDSYAAPRTNN